MPGGGRGDGGDPGLDHNQNQASPFLLPCSIKIHSVPISDSDPDQGDPDPDQDDPDPDRGSLDPNPIPLCGVSDPNDFFRSRIWIRIRSIGFGFGFGSFKTFGSFSDSDLDLDSDPQHCSYGFSVLASQV